MQTTGVGEQGLSNTLHALAAVYVCACSTYSAFITYIGMRAMRWLPCKSIPGQIALLLLLLLLLSKGRAAVQASAQQVSYGSRRCCWTQSRYAR
jgi:hypothetical protein